MNKVILIGRLTADPTLRYTQSGTGVATFTLAVNRRFANQNGEREADFINCVAWQKSAEFVANYFKKGQEMALEGRLQVRTYDGNDGQRKWVTEVVADQIEFVGAKKNNDSNNSSAAGYSGGGSGYSPDQLGEEIEFNTDDLQF